MALEALKRNGHNLHLYGFETVGPYGIPSLEPVTLDGTFPFIPFNCAKTSTVRAGLGVHFLSTITSLSAYGMILIGTRRCFRISAS